MLDADERGGVAYVVNEWGEGMSLDEQLLRAGEIAEKIASGKGAAERASHSMISIRRA